MSVWWFWTSCDRFLPEYIRHLSAQIILIQKLIVHINYGTCLIGQLFEPVVMADIARASWAWAAGCWHRVQISTVRISEMNNSKSGALSESIELIDSPILNVLCCIPFQRTFHLFLRRFECCKEATIRNYHIDTLWTNNIRDWLTFGVARGSTKYEYYQLKRSDWCDGRMHTRNDFERQIRHIFWVRQTSDRPKSDGRLVFYKKRP